MPTELEKGTLTPATGVAERIGVLVDGRYKITELMAAGSMGSVYKAERVPVGKLVAIKFLHSSFAHDAEFQARFERETRVMSKLNHPNCVSVLDFGVWENNPYLVMDFVDGTTLRHRLDQGLMSPYEALALARQILSGLAHAHAQEVFHRDIKPANIMISEEIGHGERVRILDFGLARLQGNVGRDATQINMVVGTPNYMAPEQTVPGGVIDARTDLYAVGVVLYEMIVGERPFHAEDTLQLLGMHRGAPIPRLENVLKKKRLELIPKGTQELIDRAMAKSPDARYQSAIEFAEAIDEVIEGKLDPTIEEPPPMKSGRTEKRKTGTTGMAPTVLDVDNSAVEREARARVRRSFGSTLFMALIVVAAMAGVTGYLIKRSANRKTTGERHNTAQLAQDAGVGKKTKDGGVAGAKTPDAAVQVAVTLPDAAISETPQTVDAAVRLDDAGLPIIGDDDDKDIDPTKVEDPDPEQGKLIASDEDDDAPQTEEEAEKREKEQAPPDKLAKNTKEAVQLIKQGKKTLAVLSLRQIWKQNPKSAYAPFLLGNLYFDRKWWSVALDHYRAAIRQNGGYRRNSVLNRNVIRMTASKKTRNKAWNFIRGVIGRSSKPYLRWAARHDPNPVVRKQARVLNRYVR